MFNGDVRTYSSKNWVQERRSRQRISDSSMAGTKMMQSLVSSISRQKFIVCLALGAVLTVGAVLRFHDVERRTLNHPEAYTPGIDLPWNLSNPNPRFTLWQTLAGSIAGEPHPPGYYIVMLGWTKLFGSSIFSLRLPSVLFGEAAIF